MISLFNLISVTEMRFINHKFKISVKRATFIHAANPGIAIKLKEEHAYKI